MVVNRVGGAGVLGYTYFKTKRGDPYSMMSVTATMLAMAYRPDVNIGLENYRPLALMAIDPQTIMVPANSPYKTVKDLVEAARNAPDTLVCATTSVQGTGRLVIYLLEKAVPGAKFRFVNFKGGGEAVTSTAGGHTTFTTENLSEGLGFVEVEDAARAGGHVGPAPAAGARRADVEGAGLPDHRRHDTRLHLHGGRAEGGGRHDGKRARKGARRPPRGKRS